MALPQFYYGLSFTVLPKVATFLLRFTKVLLQPDLTTDSTTVMIGKALTLLWPYTQF